MNEASAKQNAILMLNQIPWTLKDLLRVIAFSILLIVLTTSGLLVFPWFEWFGNPGQSVLLLISIAVQEISLLTPLFLIAIQKYRMSIKILGFYKIKFSKALSFIGLGYLIVIGTNIILLILSSLLGLTEIIGFQPQDPMLPHFGGGKTMLDWVIMIFSLVFFAPIVEEIFFRGFFLQTLMKRLSPYGASLITAAVFAFIHFQFGGFFAIFILGIILNWIFLKSGSLYVSIGFHIFNNSVALLIEWLIFSGYIETNQLPV